MTQTILLSIVHYNMLDTTVINAVIDLELRFIVSHTSLIAAKTSKYATTYSWQPPTTPTRPSWPLCALSNNGGMISLTSSKHFPSVVTISEDDLRRVSKFFSTPSNVPLRCDAIATGGHRRMVQQLNPPLSNVRNLMNIAFYRQDGKSVGRTGLYGVRCPVSCWLEIQDGGPRSSITVF